MYVGVGELRRDAVEEVAKRTERDNDTEKLKNDIVLYKVAEADA